MKRTFVYAACLGLILTSCKKELEPQDSSVTDSTAVATANPAAAPTVAAPAPGQPTTVTAPAAPTPAPAPQQKVAKGMNPPHGQPGHRCDIPVGAPLNSPAKQAAPKAGQAVTINQTPAATTTAPAPTSAPALLQAPAQETAPGMNPPHGQPGHRCDVPVGQPLPKS